LEAYVLQLSSFIASQQPSNNKENPVEFNISHLIRGCILPVTISFLLSILAISGQKANAEESGRYHFVTNEGKKDANMSPESELKKLNELIERDSGNAEYFYNRGWIYAQQGNHKQAEKDYTRAIQINKDHADAYYNRGLVYMETKKYDNAIRDFSEVIRIRPEAADALCNRGNAYFAQGYSLSALRDFNSAIKISPKDADLYYNRGLLYISEGKRLKGLEDMKEAAKLGHALAKEYIKNSGDNL
jgi:tetratricopeptide (TPR) repeat protein